jgi:hypothetical protein
MGLNSLPSALIVYMPESPISTSKTIFPVSTVEVGVGTKIEISGVGEI